ncbi:MAG: hypothetical protein AMXMBFR64_16580 [Myxococcales bacterium]
MSHPVLEMGSVLAGRYEIETVLASGGFATVYVARHLGLRCPVALKVLKPDLSDNPKIRKRFLREARVVTALRHPGIVVHHDLGEEEDGRMYLAMELLDGRSLARVLREGVVAPGRAVHLLRQIAAALDFSHESGVLHRDLKPSNIMTLRYAGDPDHVKLIDFGVLKFLETVQRVDDGLTTNLTEPKAVIGTPEYMAPEQIRGQPLDARTDQYALGLVAWELLAGHRPFRAATRVEVLSAQLRDPPPPLVLACGLPVPPALEDVLRRVLAKAPERRFPSCGAFVTALEGACSPLVEGDLPALPPSLPGLLVDDTAPDAPTRPSVDRLTLEAVARRHTPVRLERGGRGRAGDGWPAVEPPERAPARLPDQATVPGGVAVVAAGGAPRRRWLWAVAGGLACALAVAGWVVMPRERQGDAERGAVGATPVGHGTAPEEVAAVEVAPAAEAVEAVEEEEPAAEKLAPADHGPGPLPGAPERLGAPEGPPLRAARPPAHRGSDDGAQARVRLPLEEAIAPRAPEVEVDAPALPVLPRTDEARPQEMATLSVAVRPTGRVWIDGRRVGDGLVTNQRVKAGRRSVRVANDALGASKTVPVVLGAGASRKLLVDLETGRVDLH